MAEKEQLLEKAKLSEQAERYGDMAQCMKSVVEGLKEEALTTDQRNLLSVAYKNLVGARRSSWRVVSAIEQKNQSSNDETKSKVAVAYKKEICSELEKYCKEVLDLLDKYLIKEEPKEDTGTVEEFEARTFYLKMKGDYYRYLAEVDENQDYKAKAEEGYGDAVETATKKLPSTNPVRLGLALNRSVFYYEIKGDQEQACTLAKKAFDDAIADLDQVKEDSYKDSTLIMQLLRDNLTLWSSNNQDEKEDEEN